MWGKKKIDALVPALDCEQSLRMVTRARKSSEASESRGEAGKEAGKEDGKILPASLQFPSRPIPSQTLLTEEGLLAVYSRALAEVFEKNEKKHIKRLCLQVNKHPPPNKGKALGQNIRQAPLSNKRLTLLPHPLNFLNTVKLIKPSSSEIFLECDCVVQKRPIRLDKTKLQCSPVSLTFDVIRRVSQLTFLEYFSC